MSAFLDVRPLEQSISGKHFMAIDSINRWRKQNFLHYGHDLGTIDHGMGFLGQTFREPNTIISLEIGGANVVNK